MRAKDAPRAFITQEITRVLGALCQDLGQRPMFIFLITSLGRNIPGRGLRSSASTIPGEGGFKIETKLSYKKKGIIFDPRVYGLRFIVATRLI